MCCIFFKTCGLFTYTGNGTTKTISHSLGSVPGCIIVKRIASSSGWYFYHRSLAANNSMELQSLSSAGLTNNFANVTSTSFDVTSSSDTNENNQTYIAYVFAHNAGGFGLTGTDNVISCGSYTGNSGSQTITLGYEPQWLLVKAATGTFSDSGEWLLIDTMRGASYSSNVLRLKANTADPEGAESGAFVKPVATGFGLETGASTNINRTGITYIYIAIRRGPMKVPTDATKVFNTVLWTGNSTNNREITGVGFNPDFVEAGTRSSTVSAGFSRVVVDRLRGIDPYLETYRNYAESSGSDLVSFNNDGITVNYASSGALNNNTNIYGHFFRRAPSFFDEVCYTGTGANQTLPHNLGAVPELMITKNSSR